MAVRYEADHKEASRVLVMSDAWLDGRVGYSFRISFNVIEFSGNHLIL